MRSFLLASFALLTLVVVGCEPAAETKPPEPPKAEVKAPEVKPEAKPEGGKMEPAPTTTPAPETKPEEKKKPE
jgi:hypothetical protein